MNTEEPLYISAFRRSTAATIDMWVVLILRIIIVQFLALIWLRSELYNFVDEFKKQYGPQMLNTTEHINFFLHHKIFIYLIILVIIITMVGALYHTFLNTSAWQGTIGKRAMKIIITDRDGVKISKGRALLHYLLSLLPFIYAILLLICSLRYNITFIQAIFGSPINLILGITCVIWFQIRLFNKDRSTAYDMICKTVLINQKTAAKFPWN